MTKKQCMLIFWHHRTINVKTTAAAQHGQWGQRGHEFCTLQPLLGHQESCIFSLMFATDPTVLNSAPCSPSWCANIFSFLD